MEANTGISITHLQGPALTASVDLLAFPVFGDPTKDGLFKEVDKALGGVLGDVAKTESFEGKASQSIIVHTHGRVAAKRVLVLGGGDGMLVRVTYREGGAAKRIAMSSENPAALAASIEKACEGHGTYRGRAPTVERALRIADPAEVEAEAEAVAAEDDAGARAERQGRGPLTR